MNKMIFLISLIFTYVISAPALGSELQNEIDHLLAFVENTPCQYERNGEMHSGQKAAKHIKKKYNYYKDEINSTEKFIELSATKSTMSGKYYMIHCNGKPAIKAQDWLLQELKNYRSKSTNASLEIDSVIYMALVQ